MLSPLAHAVISEILYHTPTVGGEEFIETYNPTGQVINAVHRTGAVADHRRRQLHFPGRQVDRGRRTDRGGGL